MKNAYLMLRVSIAAALVAAATSSLAGTSGDASQSVSGVAEAPRVTQTIDNNDVVTLPNSHLAIVARASSSSALDGSVGMNHMQLILEPSAARQAAMQGLIANQHNPKSSQFNHWMTPQQFGENFGVVDSDVAAVTSWLISQGFTVNNVYPNKTQVDFSGTVAQVNHAFRTQEKIYTVDGVKRLANSNDISVPAALRSVVAGVMGLHDSRPTALLKKSELAQWDAQKKGFIPNESSVSDTIRQGITQAISFSGGVRGLVPNDMATMYGVNTIRDWPALTGPGTKLV